MQRMSRDPRMTRELVRRGTFKTEPFVLLDVGASGGYDRSFDVFEDQLRVIGFEPDPVECARLNAENKNSHVSYHPYALGEANETRTFTLNAGAGGTFPAAPEPGPRRVGCYARSSAALAARTVKTDHGFTTPSIVAPRTIDVHVRKLDDLSHTPIDFFKSDTDGHDLAVIVGARDSLSHALGVCSEVGFEPEGGSRFPGVALALERMGFALVDLDAYRYSRAALPARFTDRIPAQTASGPLFWGDALFMRDPAGNGECLPLMRALKLACLYEIFGMPDCAAEILNGYSDIYIPPFPRPIERRRLLDLLTPGGSYVRRMKRFKKHPESFYPSRFERPSRVLALVLGLVLMLLPWVLWNLHKRGEFIATATRGGTTLLEGLGEVPNDYGFVCRDEWAGGIALAHGWTDYSCPASDAYFRRLWVGAVLDRPGHVVLCVANRWHDIVRLGGAWLPLLILPAAWFRRHNREGALALLGPLVMACLSIGLVHFDARYCAYAVLTTMIAGLVCLERMLKR